MPSDSDAKEAIIAYIVEQANWRSEKAQEYPGDARNKRCADALGELADFVEGLPEDDHRLRELGSLCVLEDVFSALAGGQVAGAISRFRFHDARESCDGLLNGLVKMATEDAIELGRIGGGLPLDGQ